MSRRSVKTTWTLTTAWSLAAGLVLHATAGAQCELGEQQKLLGSAGSQFDQMGGSVAISGSVAAIGASGENTVAAFAGGVYVYRFSGGAWNPAQLLHAPDIGSSSRLGEDVALDADLLVAGAAGNSAAYVYRDSGAGYVLEQKLTASDAGPSQKYGVSVAVSDGVIAVGASQATGASTFTGAVYLYEYDSGSATWIETTKVFAADGLGFDQYGAEVQLESGRLVVGAPDHSGTAPASGAVYVHDYDASTDTATLDQKLLASDAADHDDFGRALSLDGDALVVGAPLRDDTEVDQGAAYRFSRGASWTEDEILVALDPFPSAQFGKAVALDGESLLAGANLSSAYLHRFGRQDKLTGSDTQISDRFGTGLALAGDLAIIGSPADDDDGLDAGAAYSFVIPELHLAITPTEVQSGDPLSFHVCGGQDGGLQLLVLTEVSGQFFFLKIASGVFDADGEWGFGPLPTPPGLAGIEAHFTSFGIAASGRAGGSNEGVLSFF